MTLSMTEILVLFLALMGPTKAVLVYASLTEKMETAQKVSVAIRTVIVASIVKGNIMYQGEIG